MEIFWSNRMLTWYELIIVTIKVHWIFEYTLWFSRRGLIYIYIKKCYKILQKFYNCLYKKMRLKLILECVNVCSTNIVRKRYGKSCIITFIRDGNYNLDVGVYVYVYVCVCMCMCVYVSVCMCVCSCERYGKSCITTFIREGNYYLDVWVCSCERYITIWQKLYNYFYSRWKL